MRLQKLPLAALLAACVASCSGGMGSSTAGNGTTLPQTPQFLPITQGASQASQIQTQRGPGSAGVAMRPHTTSSIQVQGKVTSVGSGHFTISLAGSCSGGYYNAFTSSSTQYSGRPQVGYYAVVTGIGSCATSIKASSVVASAVSSMNLSGTVDSVFTGGFTIDKTTCGSLHVFVTSSTSGSTPSAGHTATVGGTGSCSTYLLASSINGATSGGGGSDPSVPNHVLTSDYLGAPWGTTRVAYSTAAKYLSWAETGSGAANAIAAAGMKTMTYVAPFRVYTGNSMYTTLSTIYSHTCSGSKIYDMWDGTQEWVTNPASSSMRSNFASAVAQIISKAHFDAMFEDNAGSLAAAAVYSKFNPGLPCGYSDSSWLAAEEGLNQVSPRPVVVNTLGALNGHLPSINISMLGGSNTLGGNMEDCYSTNNQPKENGWLWQAVENTELQVLAKGKQFTCMLMNYNSASASIGPRLFAYASFLLTYRPTTAVIRTEFGTSSGLHVMPETGFVPLNPLVSAPSTIAGLQVSTNVYARKYSACYLRGVRIGACAVVVNADAFSSHPFPFSGYHHTLALSGGGVVDGGTASASGSAPSSMPALTGVIALP
jgi:hypothetical protein